METDTQTKAAYKTAKLLAMGDTALTVEFGTEIDPLSNARVLALEAAITGMFIPGIVETVPTYRSLTVHIDPVTVDMEGLQQTLQALAARPVAVTARPGHSWQVPVVYGGSFGPDLEAAAKACGLTPAELVTRHSAGSYTIAMIGFLPGFSYLSGLDPRLAIPRREEPRLQVAASSISIGGAQTAIGSVSGPSGWHMLGRTPARPFVQDRKPQALFAPGDRISFAPIDAGEWDRLDAAAAKGQLVITEMTR
ncbi:5-oxoprolinase subunit PxpB [Rhodophyticola sp. CCM32]|uniref:5-oxoprolinase subunit PxpB n=1 Tax=Rhodophyticola sp. CCM32 TaxID=2916397 RepID=UPI00107F7BAA|nr:5-oxoprolinase subunit PxpB [Rhodophyticola sp. CCM32]QBY01342.1 5-oxoprolinase subunit PxpB [Rhodophyticola sp. CCM32]